MQTIGSICGMRIVSTSSAINIRTVWSVERHPIPKRRRQWRVVKRQVHSPGVFQVGDVFYMHPHLIEQLIVAKKLARKRR